MLSSHPILRRSILVLGVTAVLGASAGCPKKVKRSSKGPAPVKSVKSATLKLPTSVSTMVGIDAPGVQVRSDAIAVAGKVVVRLRQGKVHSTLKRDGDDGFFIEPLFRALRDEARKLTSEEKRGGMVFKGVLRVAADRKTSFRLLAEVLYTGQQAGFSTPLLAVKRPDGVDAVVWVDSPRFSRPRRRNSREKRLPLKLSVVMTDRGFYVKSRHGSECPASAGEDAPLCIKSELGRYTPTVFKKLQHHLWYLFASKYRDPSHHGEPGERWGITFIPEPTVRFSDVIRALDAMREIPANPTNPKLKHRLPTGGCALKYDKKAGSFGFVEQRGESVRDTGCMYYKVALALGSS